MTLDAPRPTPTHVIALAALAALAAPIAIVVVARRAEPVRSPAPAPDPDVHEAPRPQLSFVGNHEIPAQALAAVVRTSLRDRGPPYDRDVLDMVALELSAYYWDRGYATVQIEPPKLDPAGLELTIHEGPVFTLASVEVQGVPAAEAAADLAVMHEHAGDRFSRRVASDDVQALEARYGDAGHAFASIEPRSKLDPEHRTIALQFWIDAGPRVRIGRVEVYPHGRMTADAMRRLLTVAPGQWYTQAALLDTKRRLQALGLGDVAVSTEHGASPAQVDVAFELVVGDW